MQKMKKTMRTGLLYILSLLLLGSSPLMVAAEAVPVSSTTTSIPPNPSTPEHTYTFNPVTNHWDSDEWVYDAASQSYQPVAPVIVAPTPPLAPEITSPTDPTNPFSTSTALAPSQQSLLPGVTAGDPTLSSTTNVDTKNSVTNNLDSQALTGNAGVDANTLGGNAGTGDALAATTIVNTVHSTLAGDTAGVAHFEADIYGNVTGDITLSPAINGLVSQPSPILTDINTNVKTTNDLTNNINLGATSGNADVTNNTTAGSATTGDANTVANVVNLINSIIAANKSFIGTINIYGNLDGDILISPEFIPQLLASNAPDNLAAPLVGDFSSNLSDTQSIVNNISLGAQTGTANVAGNTSAGNATTGTAATNLTILNLTGKEVVAKNSVLVFVNVLGKWVGLIVNAPEGATAAALGSGVTSNTTGGTLSQTVDATTKDQITNNITLASQSGNANVTGNTKAGNATTGNATASANILNMSTSSFAISDWFGILFINVFGSWYGSFGVNTANGEVKPLGGMAISGVPAVATSAAPPFQFGFNPHVPSPHMPYGGGAGTIDDGEGPVVDSGVVLASATTNGQPITTIVPSAATHANDKLGSVIMMGVGFAMVSGTLLFKAIRRRQEMPLAMTDSSGV